MYTKPPARHPIGCEDSELEYLVIDGALVQGVQKTVDASYKVPLN
jgi:hypothetical protein